MMWRINDMCSDTSSSDSDVLPGFFPIYCDFRGTMTDRKVYQAYKGQLKLSVYINYGLLTVHVMRVRNLQCQPPNLCDTYIKLCLDPDTTNRTCCMTEVVHDSNNPLFDEKFSFELLQEDVSKRLLISVWNRATDLSEDEFLGSMSFGLQHIQQQGQIVAGWYYLLMGDVGNTKHLRVQDKKSSSSGGSIPSVNTDIKWMEPHTFVLTKKRGFGFTLCGSSPVSVSKVEPGGAAASVGLRKGDCIVKLDGVNVSRSTADSIARIFRHAEKHVMLEVHRPHHQAAPRDGGTVGWRPPLSDRESNCQPQKIEKLNVSPWKPPPNIRTTTDVEMETEETRHYGWLESGDRLHDVQPKCRQARLVSSRSQQDRPLGSLCQNDGTLRVYHQRNGPLSMCRQENGPLSMCQQHNGPVIIRQQQNGPLSIRQQENGPLSMRQPENGLFNKCQQQNGPCSMCQQNGPLSMCQQENGLLSMHHQQNGPSSMCQQHNGPLNSLRLQNGPLNSLHQQNGPQCLQYDSMRTLCLQDDPCRTRIGYTGSLGRSKLPSKFGRTLQGASTFRDGDTRWYSQGKENEMKSLLPSGGAQHRKVSFKDF